MKNMEDRFSGLALVPLGCIHVFMVRETNHRRAVHQWITFNYCSNAQTFKPPTPFANLSQAFPSPSIPSASAFLFLFALKARLVYLLIHFHFSTTSLGFHSFSFPLHSIFSPCLHQLHWQVLVAHSLPAVVFNLKPIPSLSSYHLNISTYQLIYFPISSCFFLLFLALP